MGRPCLSAPSALTAGDCCAVHGPERLVRRVAISCTASTSTCAEGEVVTLLGRNGAGKTTTLQRIMGLVGRRSGTIRFDGARD